MPDRAEDVTPDPESLVESLRDFGYTLPSALADLIDNSLTAGARHIELSIASDASVPAHIVVVDDGEGMSLETLIAALRLGTHGPLHAREQKDLGRFGLGLKTASLSQGRCLTVITKRSGESEPIIRSLDLDHIRTVRSWQLLKGGTPASLPFVETIAARSSGTAVVIERLDRATFLRVNPSELHEFLGSALNHVRSHLEMVFHHFLQGGVSIRLGQTSLEPWDPFLSRVSSVLPSETLRPHNHTILVHPYVLPHHTKLSDDEHARAGGPHGWNNHQGFYIYRCNRLIVPGTWLNLSLKKEEHYKLGRIAVYLPNSVDAEWHLNVMKSHVAAPAYLRDDLRRIATKLRKEASEVYRFRGERQAPSAEPAQRYVWRREQARTGVRYRIDRTHPVVRALVHAGCGHDTLLENVLALIERTLPVASILQEPGKSADGSVSLVTDEELDAYATLLCHAEQFLVATGKSPAAARQSVLTVEPFVRFKEELLLRLGPSSSGHRETT
jgi:hypothetical protein